MRNTYLHSIKNVLSTLVATLFTIISFAQNKGDNVELVGEDGKTYTGKITEISNGKYKVLYDGYDFSAWLTDNQFKVINSGTPVPPQSKKNNNNGPNTAAPQKSTGQIPTIADITATLKSIWETEGTSLKPKETTTVNSIKIGSSEKSNYAQQLEGVPKTSVVTHAKIDFTQNIFYTNETQQVRRIMTAWVYRDQFNEWKIMNAGVVYPDK